MQEDRMEYTCIIPKQTLEEEDEKEEEEDEIEDPHIGLYSQLKNYWAWLGMMILQQIMPSDDIIDGETEKKEQKRKGQWISWQKLNFILSIWKRRSPY